MTNSNNRQSQHNNFFNKITIKLALLIAVSGLIGIPSLDLNQNSVTAQTLQQTCNSDNGMNVSKSNCFSDEPTNPMYNSTNTNNVRPPPDNNSTLVNSSK